MPAKKNVTKKSTPTNKKAAKKSVKKSAPKKKQSKMQEVNEPVKMPAVCQSCNALPIGSMELVSLLLVVTFSLSAILLTSVYAMEQQADRIDNLESQVQYYQTLE